MSSTTAGAAPSASPGDELVSLKLPDADINTMLDTLKLFTGKVILRPSMLQTPQGGYNLEVTNVPKSQTVIYIETILAMNGIAVVPMGNDALKIVNLPFARMEAPPLISGSTLDLPPSNKIASKLFELKFLRAQEFQQMLNGIINQGVGSAPIALPNANSLLITDTISNLQRIELLQDKVDQPDLDGMMPRFFPLQHAKASDLVAKLHTILSGSLQQQIGNATTYSADDRTNQIVLIADPREYPLFEKLITRLDVESEAITRNEVIYLKHAKASDVVQVLMNLIRGQNTINQRSQSTRSNATPNAQMPEPGQPGGALRRPVAQSPLSATSAENLSGVGASEFSSLVTVVNDDRSNSIVVSGTVDDIRLMHQLIDKLDIVLAQVRIEVVIAEVSLEDNHQSGIDALGLKVEGDRLVGFTGSGPGFSVGGSDGTSGSFASISRLGGPGSLGRSLDLAGIISLATTLRKNNSIILSEPTITTSHAKEATIFVGETHPIITGSVNNGSLGGTTSTTTEQQIGINLDVTPLIGNDNTVQLDIKQDVDEVGPNVTIDGNPVPIIFKRTTQSFVTVKNDDIIVLGGLQRDDSTTSRNRLGPIPIIGDLLGSRQRDEKRTELIMFLRPHILTNTPLDNVSTFKRVDKLPQRDEILKEVYPNYEPPAKKSLLDRILPH